MLLKILLPVRRRFGTSEIWLFEILLFQADLAGQPYTSLIPPMMPCWKHGHRRIAMLEERLGARLIQRSTRRFVVTEAGQTYYMHCKAMLVEAEAAQEAIDTLKAEPRGVIRMTCPLPLLHAYMGVMLAEFMARYPYVMMHVDATNRRVDLVSKSVDVALRVRPPPLENSDLAIRVLVDRSQCLAASPALVQRFGSAVALAELSNWPSLGLGTAQQIHSWVLHGPDGAHATFHHTPRFVTTDMIALRHAAMAGVGVVQLPVVMARDQLAAGLLVRVVPDWAPPPGNHSCDVSVPTRSSAICARVN
jgi:DNA-binding transcriptional LysR family regulator